MSCTALPSVAVTNASPSLAMQCQQGYPMCQAWPGRYVIGAPMPGCLAAGRRWPLTGAVQKVPSPSLGHAH
ncbi:hypothetical protein HaLaN_08560 [Haematococcus lacustris]|uniref:Uncharacterized protein n=1 Tax=Haematococcus lacustris TaxID=44745 RepID=A0A699Z0M5_HAELA|nr:hypothetical protein HaLaN_08560 [Haematococcus lacustris]